MKKLYFTEDELKLLDAALVHLLIFCDANQDDRKNDAYLLKMKIHRKRKKTC